MKKLNQLVLLITCIVSITLLLIYRHEYNRLRYVLEVFNFFGQPPDCTYPDFLNTTTSSHDWGPVPVWQTVDNMHMYSAFLHSSNEIEAIGIANKGSSSIQNCHVWYEDKLKPVIGKLMFSKVNNLNDYNGNVLNKYTCKFDEKFGLPYAVSFSVKNKRTKEYKKIILHQPKQKKQNYSVVCLLPLETYSKSSLLEFLSYYKILGVDTFIVYNSNIPHRTMQLLQNLSPKLGMRVTNYPWNYPGSEDDSTRAIIEQDCLLRTNRESKNVFVLDASEYIVPRYHHTLPLMLDHYDPKNLTQRFVLKSLTFCVVDDGHREPSVLHNLLFDTARPEDTLTVFRAEPRERTVQTQEITPGIAAVHRFVQCTPHPSHSRRDNSALRFRPDLLRSTLVRLAMHGRP